MIKKTIFIIIPYILLLCCLAYGIDILTAKTTTGIALTYMQTETINGTLIYKFDTIQWLQDISTFHIEDKLTTLFNFFNSVISQFKSYASIWGDGYDFGDGLKTIVNTLSILINTISIVLNGILYILQLLVYVLGKLVNIIGINTSAQWLNPLRVMLETSGIPLIPMWI